MSDKRYDRKRNRAIREAPRPSTKRQIKSFLGLTVFFFFFFFFFVYRRFIPNFSSIASPLTDLKKKNRPNSVKVLQDHHENTFHALKNRLSSSPILRLPVFRRIIPLFSERTLQVAVVVALLFYVHGKHLRSCRDGQLT